MVEQCKAVSCAAFNLAAAPCPKQSSHGEGSENKGEMVKPKTQVEFHWDGISDSITIPGITTHEFLRNSVIPENGYRIQDTG